MPNGGKLTLEVANAMLDDAYAAGQAEVTPGQYVVICVSDTGIGMDGATRGKAFEPFFTTKEPGRGTGLGLSMVYGYVKQSGGHVSIYSEVGQGTTVKIYLPRRQGQGKTAVQPEETVVPEGGGGETVLVVEDDEDVRNTVVDMLSNLGYRVLKAKDAASALAIVESGVPVDVLFSDVVMPGPMRSPEMARKVRERLPGIAVLFTSGYTDNAIVHTGRLDAGIELLSKPYTHEALARKVRQMLVSGGAKLEPVDAAAADMVDGAPTLAAAVADGMAIDMPRHQRVVFVEDDDLLRASTAELMRTLGFDVIEARNDVEAMAALCGEGIDILLTDVGLGGVSGVDLAIDACRLRPALRVIFVSGYEVVLTPAQRDALPNAVMLRKPYALTDFINVLQARPEGG